MDNLVAHTSHAASERAQVITIEQREHPALSFEGAGKLRADGIPRLLVSTITGWDDTWMTPEQH